jgi:hypothetical protein
MVSAFWVPLDRGWQPEAARSTVAVRVDEDVKYRRSPGGTVRPPRPVQAAITEAGDIAARREHHFRVMIRTPMSLVATEAVSVGLQILALTWSGKGTFIATRISPDGSGTVP